MDDSLFVSLFGIVALVVVIVTIGGVWKVFEKAGRPGWGCLIPIYNVILMLGMPSKPLWWIVLLIIPLVSIVITIMIHIEIAKTFGKSARYSVGLALLPMIFYPMLGFSDARYPT
jgi:Family of unknown function (DUF5684)